MHIVDRFVRVVFERNARVTCPPVTVEDRSMKPPLSDLLHSSSTYIQNSCLSKRITRASRVLPVPRRGAGIDAGGQPVPGPRPRSRRAAPRPRESPRERHADGHIGCIRRTVLSPRPCKARAPTSSTFRAATDLPLCRICAAPRRRGVSRLAWLARRAAAHLEIREIRP